jgi:hypothetical protein
VRRGSDIEGLLRQSGLHREMLADAGTHIVRRRLDDGHLYFLHHIGTEARSGWVELAVPARSAVWMDAGTGRTGAALLRHENGDRATVFLRTEPGESLFLRTYTEREAEAAPFPFTVPAGDGVSLDGPWQVEFLDGGPTLPAPRTVDALTSWTQWTPQSDSDREALHEFSGTVRYRRTFDAPPNPAENYRLELGRVCHSARVRLNGTNLGTVYARPWQIALPPLRPTGNILEIEVTNLMANRLAALDRSGADWQKFFFVNINYKPFSAKSWEPLPSGLLGPVRLVPQQSPVL